MNPYVYFKSFKVHPYIYVTDPFEVNFCVWLKVGIQFHSRKLCTVEIQLGQHHPLKKLFFPIEYLATHVENQLVIDVWVCFYYGLSILFRWSVDLSYVGLTYFCIFSYSVASSINQLGAYPLQPGISQFYHLRTSEDYYFLISVCGSVYSSFKDMNSAIYFLSFLVHMHVYI